MSSELGLDPSDPLNLLLRNSSDDPDSQDNAQAWSTLSSLWSDPVPPTDPSKSYVDMMPMDFSDLTSSMAMDMDFNNPMAIEPSILQFDPVKFANAFAGYDDQYGLSTDLMATQFPFSFQFNNGSGQITSSSSGSSASDSPQSFTKERRLSVTSSSSSSGASLSPVPESLASPATGGYVSDTQPKEEPIPLTEVPHAHDPAAELAARVRQAAGVMLAVPMGAQLQGYGAQILPKLPIPRLSRHDSVASKSTPSSSSSAASTPPPSTPPPSTLTTNPPPLRLSLTPALPSDSSAPYTPIAPTPTTTTLTTTASARPKTSHTTIERRYRTNLNARIQSLRMAVPALRVLEDREGGTARRSKRI
ncbi:hypothetical protein CPB84DRAFT_362584 [Gymnopilus junonius]|uniref:BHLH domain-containing protein n=1 Tax=Gymnopilus junonius TaxID=109634 RepID=A0A9P5TRG4_GYMJU|nr:hypothetical protein CPB84DRAFT_362584 [Gymnopilus junonius]